MTTYTFASLTSITKGLHKDKRTEREFKELNNKFKSDFHYSSTAFYTIEFSEKPFGSKRKYYKTLIDLEATRKFNKLIEEFPDNAIEEENIFNYQLLYNQYKQYLIAIKNYIEKYNYKRDTLTEENTFIIQYLKTNIIWLFLELQERYAKYGNEDEMTIKEVYKYYFNESLNEYDIQKSNVKSIEEEQTNIVKHKLTTKKKAPQKISFGYLKEDPDLLLKILNRLQLSIDLLDIKTDVKDLQNLLLSKDFTKFKKKIYLDCKTTEFKYLLKQLQPYFKNLTPTLVEATGLFRTKSDKPLKAHDFYTSGKIPLKKETIDNIFKQMQ